MLTSDLSNLSNLSNYLFSQDWKQLKTVQPINQWKLVLVSSLISKVTNVNLQYQQTNENNNTN